MFLKSKKVRQIAKMLTEMDVNEKTPHETPYLDLQSLAEAMVGNVMEFQSLDSFEDFLKLFSLGEEVFKVLVQYFEANLDSLLECGSDLETFSSAADEVSEDLASDVTGDTSFSIDSCEYFDSTDEGELNVEDGS